MKIITLILFLSSFSSMAFDLSGISLKLLPMTNEEQTYISTLKKYNPEQYKEYLRQECIDRFGDFYNRFIQVRRGSATSPFEVKPTLLGSVTKFFSTDTFLQLSKDYPGMMLQENLGTGLQIYCSGIKERSPSKRR